MTHEEKKAAVLAECKRLWNQRKELPPHSPENPKNYVDGMRPLGVTPSDDGWKLSVQYGFDSPIGPLYLYPDCEAEHIVWPFAYRLLGLDKPPADTRWERLKANLKTSHEAYLSVANKMTKYMTVATPEQKSAFDTACNAHNNLMGLMYKIEEGEL